MLSEKHTWNILGDHFKKYGFVHHQTDSFNSFINFSIPRIINEEPGIDITPTDKDAKFLRYRVNFENPYLPSPTITEETRVSREAYPAEIRRRDLSYDSPLYVDVTEILEIDGCPPEITTHNRVVIGRLPIMIRSSKCYLTNMTPDERIKAGECEYDEGGYFVIKGKERVLVAQIRGIYNTIIVLENKPDDKISFVAEMRSMSEETGHSVLLSAMISSDNRSLFFQLPYIKDSIPIGAVFKAYGYRPEQFANLIGISGNNALEKYLKLIINDSFFLEEDGFIFYTKKRKESIKKLSNSSKKKDEINLIILEEWEKMKDSEHIMWQTEGTRIKALNYIGSRSGDRLKDNELLKYSEQVLDSEIFPHMGITSTTKEKAFLLGSMVQKLLFTHSGLRNPDDRDNYINKRIDSSGILCSDLFKQLFKKYKNSLVTQIEKRKQLPDVMAIIPRQSDITKGFYHCFGTGNWGVPKNSYVRQGVSQILSRLSYGATLSAKRRIAIPVGKESKNREIRQINPSQIMYICPVETPEGAPVGIVLNLSLLTRVSERTPTVLVKEILVECDNIITMENFKDLNEKTKVLLNGVLIGMTDDPIDLVKELKKLRYIKILNWDVSITYEDMDDEIRVFSDEGRLLRPVFVLENGKLKATQNDGTDWDTLVEKGLITYIDNMEANCSVIAFNQTELSKYRSDYCEISAAMMLGVMGSIIPFPEHSPSPRNSYQAAMGKQAMSIFCLSHLIRTDTVVHVLETPQKPLVSTISGDMLGFSDMPSGINCIVAIACYSGFNQEDSVILNGGAVKRGLFSATTYRTYTEEEKKQGYNHENISLPPLNKRMGDANYGLLDENGIVIKRHPVWIDKKGKKHGGGSVYVQKGDVIIGKVSVQSSKNCSEEIIDCSLVIKKGEEGYIDRIFTSITPNGYKQVKIVIRRIRIPEVGDKFASRAAQKGIVGMVYDQVDMPFTDDGITPDIIINPHCIPSRMTINQLLECVLGKSCAIEGTYGDSTPFSEFSIGGENKNTNIAEQLCDRLGLNGYERTGKELMYNGMTGEPMGMFFIGPVYYQRLKHLVSDKIHARSTGPVTTLARQPLEGRSRDGGLRFGEMERDCMIGHGTSKFLQERLFEQSDKYSVSICSKCRNFSTSRTECKSCETDQIDRVHLPYVSKLLLQELNAMMILTKITAKQ